MVVACIGIYVKVGHNQGRPKSVEVKLQHRS